MIKIPFFDIKRQYNLIKDEVENAVLKVMRSSSYIEGYAVRDFELEISQYLNVKNAITCNSGTDALRIALQAVGVKAGDEVITTPFSFFATAEAISQIGAVPVFADISKSNLNIDPNQIEKMISSRTKAILPVHIFGLPADMNEINEIANRHGIAVIEDACQAIGASYNGNKTGTLGNIGCFSFYPTKNLGAFGDGGMITTDDDNLAVIAQAYKSHGAGQIGATAWSILTGDNTDKNAALNQTSASLYDPCKYYNYLIGGNSRLDSIQAAVLSVKLKHLDDFNLNRARISNNYTKAFSRLPFTTPKESYTDRVHCWHQYVILTEERDQLADYLNKQGIGTGAFYPVPLHFQRAFVDLDYHVGDLPVTEDVCKKSLCLPIYPELTDTEIYEIIEKVCLFFQ